MFSVVCKGLKDETVRSLSSGSMLAQHWTGSARAFQDFGISGLATDLSQTLHFKRSMTYVHNKVCKGLVE